MTELNPFDPPRTTSERNRASKSAWLYWWFASGFVLSFGWMLSCRTYLLQDRDAAGQITLWHFYVRELLRGFVSENHAVGSFGLTHTVAVLIGHINFATFGGLLAVGLAVLLRRLSMWSLTPSRP